MARTASGKLGAKHRVLAEALTSAEARLAAGEAPTVDAARDWERLAELDRLRDLQADSEVSDHCSADAALRWASSWHNVDLAT